ncbi:hypothetical protein D3C72_1277890 [compost metagenome]
MIEHGFGVAGAAIGVLAGEQLQQDHAQAIDVAARIQRLALGLLRAAVGRAADGHVELGQLAVQRQVLGNAEIGEHRGAVVAEQNVGRLDVTVHQPVVMHHRQGAGDLPHDAQCLHGLQHLALVAAQVAPGEEFHGQVIPAVG